MANSQSSQLIDAAKEDRARANYEPARSQTFYVCEDRIKVPLAAGIEDTSSSLRLRAADSTSRACPWARARSAGLIKKRHDRSSWEKLMQQFQQLWLNLNDQTAHARNISARPVQVNDEA